MSTDLLVISWVGEGALRMEVARVERRGTELVGEGMQVGASYGLWYRLEPGRLTPRALFLLVCLFSFWLCAFSVCFFAGGGVGGGRGGGRRPRLAWGGWV